MISTFSQYTFLPFSFFTSELYREGLPFLQNEVNNFLEIGSMHGGGSCYFSDFFMDHESSTLDCVDPFSSILDPPATDSDEELFLENISKSKNYSKCTFHKKTSREFFSTNTKKFNFILIDGSSIYEDVKFDLENSFAALTDGGIMWINDYKSIFRQTPTNEFMIVNQGKFTVVHEKYQLGIRKNITDSTITN